MELIKSALNQVKRDLNGPIILKRGSVITSIKLELQKVNGIMKPVEPPTTEIRVGPYNYKDSRLDFFDDTFFSELNKEVDENLRIPVTKELKYNYLNEILSFLLSIESLIKEDEQGILSCELFQIYKDKEPYTWEEETDMDVNIMFFRVCLRKEIIHISDLLKAYELCNDKSYPQMKWKGSDTELLELIQALLETKKISSSDKELSRKDAIRLFEQIFSIEIKDAESKLSRATERKVDNSPFLTSLKEAFNQYCQSKEEKKNQRN